MQIELPEDVRQLADEEVASGRFASLGDDLATLVREDRHRADPRLRELLRARLASGPGEEMTDAAFDDIRARLQSQIQRRRGA